MGLLTQLLYLYQELSFTFTSYLESSAHAVLRNIVLRIFERERLRLALGLRLTIILNQEQSHRLRLPIIIIIARITILFILIDIK